MQKMSMRIEDIEVRTCAIQLIQTKPHTTAEIIRWHSNDHCYVLAYWVKGSEGFDLIFCGRRPFEHNISVETFFRLARIGQNYLDRDFKEELSV